MKVRSIRLVACAAAAAAAAAGPATATPMQVSGSLAIRLPFRVAGVGNQPFVFAQSPDPVLVSVQPDGAFALPAAIFGGTISRPSLPVSGVTIAGPIRVSVSNTTGSFGPGLGGGGGFGGEGRLVGSALIEILGFNLALPLDAVGASGISAFPGTPLGFGGTLTAAPWTAGPAMVTGVSIPRVRRLDGATGAAVTLSTFFTPGSFASFSIPVTPTAVTIGTLTRVTLHGSDARTPGGAGSLMLVTPIRIHVSASQGSAPAFAIQTLQFSFVPEPGSVVLLLSSAALGTLGVHRRRSLR